MSTKKQYYKLYMVLNPSSSDNTFLAGVFHTTEYILDLGTRYLAIKPEIGNQANNIPEGEDNPNTKHSSSWKPFWYRKKFNASAFEKSTCAVAPTTLELLGATAPKHVINMIWCALQGNTTTK